MAQQTGQTDKTIAPEFTDRAQKLGELIAPNLPPNWPYDYAVALARKYAPPDIKESELRAAIITAGKLNPEGNPKAEIHYDLLSQSRRAPASGKAPVPTTASGPAKSPRTRLQKPMRRRLSESPRSTIPQQQDNRVWLANVFQRIYGAGFNQPNGYRYAVSEEKDDSGNIVRSIRIFRADDANAPSYVFKAQPDKTWTLYSGDGKELVRNVYYDPKTKRFFVAGVSEDDVLKALQPLQQQNQTPQQSSNAPQPMIPGAVWFQMLDDNTAVAKTIDNKIRILRNAGSNQWIILREMDYDEFINPTGGGAPSGVPSGAPVGQTTPNTTNDQEQGMNWLYLMLPLLAIILSRR